MNVLAVGAHFDDVELGCSGALAKHVKSGDSVYIYVATDSQYANPKGKIVRKAEDARKEGEQAAALIGAELICGSCKSLYLEFEEKINAALVKLIEEKQIDLIYVHWTDDIQHDHINLSRAVIHAGRHVPRILMYRSNWYISAGNFKENFFVDISDTWEIKERAILAHQSECKRVDSQWADYLKRDALNKGLIAGVKYAECFETVKWLV